jgi:N-acetylmuramic acid 6-phosphate etherase
VKNQPSITESESRYQNLERMPLSELLAGINREDQTVPNAVEAVLPQVESLVERAATQLKNGGRLFYIGAGTSGRLGVVDASECPPTFGVDHGVVVGLIAGGDPAIRKAVEFAEDDIQGGWHDLQSHEISANDMVVGIAASGTTPYVVGALKKCQEQGIPTGCITCNPDAPLLQVSDFPIACVVGPEFVTGSTRMKAGTAQKLILNMISTACMIQLGRVKGNRMVDMQLSNSKLVRRGTRMLMDALDLDAPEAEAALKTHGSVRAALEALLP